MALTTIKTGGLADNSVTDAKVADAITVTGAQTGITSVGTLTSFRSTGIDDNADALAVTIDSSENIGIGATSISATDWGSASPIVQISGTQPLLSFKETDATKEFQLALSGGAFYLYDADNSATRLLIADDGSATFGGDLLVPQYIKHVGDTDCHIEFGTDEIKLRTGDSSRLIARDANVEIYPPLVATSATFTGNTIIQGDNKSLDIKSADYSNVLIGNAGSSGAGLDRGIIILRENGSNKTLLYGDGQATFGSLTMVENTTEAIFRVKKDADYTELAQNNSGGVLTFQKADGSTGAQISSYGNSIFNGGNIGIGTTSPVTPLDIHSTGTEVAAAFGMADDDTAWVTTRVGETQNKYGAYGFMVGSAAVDGVSSSNCTSYIASTVENNGGSLKGSLKFYTNSGDNLSQALRIDENQMVGIKAGGVDPAYRFEVWDNTDTWVQRIVNQHGNAYGLWIDYPDSSPDNNDRKFFMCEDSSEVKCIIWSDGDVNNDDGAYGTISDVRIKQGIRDANSQWDDIKAMKIRNFKKNHDVIKYGDKAWEQIGVVAQELEEAGMDKLVREHTALESEVRNSEDINEGDMVKSVQSSIIYMKAVKCLQEAMAKIETLEAKVEALENG